MKLDAVKRDLNVKGRKFKNEKMTIGIIKRKDGGQLPIALKRNAMERFLKLYGDNGNALIKVEDQVIDATVIRVERDVIFHFPHHVEFIEN